MIIKENIKNLRKKLLNEKFIVRIRENGDDIVYYNGIKVFNLKEENDKVELTIPDNLYKCSFDDIKTMWESDSTIETELRMKIDLLETFKKKNYFSFEMSSISFKKAGDYNHEEMYTRFEKFLNHLINDLKIDLDNINIDDFIDDFLKNFEKEKKGTINFKEPITDIHDIIYIQYYYFMDLKITIDGKNVSQYKKTTSLPKFGSSLITDTKKVLNDDEISDLLDNIRKVVETSNVKEYEKRYQFMFMLYASKMASNLFGECYYPFEQEYVFYNQSRKDKNKEDNGKECRIDCVLFKYNETINKMTDLYLIELKVDDSVVSGNNGVLTHLDDINSLFFEGGNKNDNYEYREKINYEFFNYIRENIEYRMKQLDSNFEYRMNQPDSNFKYDEKNELDFNVHFYTIFGFTNEECKENIKYVLEKLKTIEGVKELSKNTDSKLKLDSYFKDNNKTLQTYINNKNEYNKGKKYTYDIKFFFDKNIFDFESWNKHLYRDNMSFIYCDLNNDIEKIKW